MRCLGIDISSTTIGVAIVDNGNTLVFMDFFSPSASKKDDLLDKLSKSKKYLINLIDTYKPDVIAIEDIILAKNKLTTIKTLATLAIFNKALSLAILDYTNKKPHFFNVLKIRHKIKIDSFPKKEDVPDLVAKHLKISFPWKKKKDKIIKQNYDMADAIAVALTYFLEKKK